MSELKVGDIVIGRLDQWYFEKFIGLFKGRVTFVHKERYFYDEKASLRERFIDKWHDINVEPLHEESWKVYGIPPHIFHANSTKFVHEKDWKGTMERDWEKDFESFYIPLGEYMEDWIYSPETVKKYFRNLIDEIKK